MSVALDAVHKQLAETSTPDHRHHQRRAGGGRGVGVSSGLPPPKPLAPRQVTKSHQRLIVVLITSLRPRKSQTSQMGQYPPKEAKGLLVTLHTTSRRHRQQSVASVPR